MWLKVLVGIWGVAKQTGLDKVVKGWIIRRVDASANKYDDKLLAALSFLKKIREEA